MLLAVLGAMLLTSGCKSLFPSSTTTVASRWETYSNVSAAFGRIVPYETDAHDLKELGFDPEVSSNVKTMSYVELLPIFMPNSGIQKKDLPAPVRDYIDAHEGGMAYAIDLQNVQSKRYGHLILDVFDFKRKTHTTGWKFRGLILMKNDIVVYKLSSGEPDISTFEKKTRPLGPFQELDSVFFHIVGSVK